MQKDLCSLSLARTRLARDYNRLQVKQVPISTAHRGYKARRVRTIEKCESSEFCGAEFLGADGMPETSYALGDGTWLCEFCIMPRCAEEATAYTWGGNSAWGCRDALYCSNTLSA